MHYLTDRFQRFFGNLNVGTRTEQTAAREYAAIKALIENPNGHAAELGASCFLQGSYRQQTAIHDLNDVDIVALCQLWHPGSGGPSTRSWGRDDIFATIAAPLLNDARYRNRVQYGSGSMCIKVDLDIKVEILPVVFVAENNDPQHEPFRLFRPETGEWEDGYARRHQQLLSLKNNEQNTNGTFIPTIKVLKHLRTIFGRQAVSFHIESLLFRLPHHVFRGAPVEYIPRVLGAISALTAEEWWNAVPK
jgi:hypothetical protein